MEQLVGTSNLFFPEKRYLLVLPGSHFGRLCDAGFLPEPFVYVFDRGGEVPGTDSFGAEVPKTTDNARPVAARTVPGVENDCRSRVRSEVLLQHLPHHRQGSTMPVGIRVEIRFSAELDDEAVSADHDDIRISCDHSLAETGFPRSSGAYCKYDFLHNSSSGVGIYQASLA